MFNLLEPIKSKKVFTCIKHLTTGVEDCGCYTGEDFKKFCREFKSMINEQLKLVGGTNYKQNNGHYYISGFFTVGEQVYYINFSDVRYNNGSTTLLIRTAKDYKDFTGGTNHYIEIKDEMFINKLPLN